MFRSLRALLLAAGLSLPGAAGTSPLADRDVVGGIPMDVLTHDIPLRESLARVHRPVTTDSPRAQAYYDQGASYLLVYGWVEAARSFHAALRLDPDLVLARIGLAEARRRLRDREAGLAALEAAEAVAGDHLTRAERDWLELRGRLLRSRWGLSDWEDDEREAYLAEVVERHPERPEFLFQQARLQSGEERIQGYHEVLESTPDHIGAHHQLVHRYERDPERVALAVRHGERLVELAPVSSHARHMLGHNLGRVGRMNDALRAFEAADAIERRLAREEGLPLEHNWHQPTT